MQASCHYGQIKIGYSMDGAVCCCAAHPRVAVNVLMMCALLPCCKAQLCAVEIGRSRVFIEFGVCVLQVSLKGLDGPRL